ncbi:Fic family protein [Chitinophaga sp. HK235]|uniref:Fic family protein n=1 Tax=Chitinophaga sp. HK235 TaxID=2952571 RepID=UPI001BAE13E3|nr:Fic family protein [Chitinophaga sp. HK235]
MACLRATGAKLTDQQVEKLLGNLAIKQFTSRDEEEVAGYADVMNLIFENYIYIPLTEGYIQQLHRELLKHSSKDNWHRGNYKKSPNHVEAFDQDGKSLGIVFETASPFDTQLRMQELVSWTVNAIETKVLHPLLIICIFIVVFLAIHPFQDGNGRLSRILTTVLLLRAGYAYVPYSSLEAVIEQSKEGYYLALRRTQGSLKTENPDWMPWILFFYASFSSRKPDWKLKLNGKSFF